MSEVIRERNSVKILHCADIHLGTEFASLGDQTKAKSLKLDLNRAFLNIIELCTKEEVDVLLIAGDLFDGWNIADNIVDFVRDSFANIPKTKVVISAGNHDPATLGTPYLRDAFWPENVYILSSLFDCIVFDDIKTEVWGASFSNAYSEIPLLGEARSPRDHYVKLGVLHGTLGSDGQSNIYNPISPQKIKASNLDYLALGHIHKFSGILTENNTRYAYSGCPMGRGFDETGEKGVIMGTVLSGGWAGVANQLEFVKTSNKMYFYVEINITGCITVNEIAECIRKMLENNNGEHFYEHLYKISLVGNIDFSIALESLKAELGDIFFIKLRDRTMAKINIDDVAKEETLRGVFVRNYLEKLSFSEKDDWKELLENALNIGLKSFSGAVNFYED